MTKSLGNVILPEEVVKDYGADILRLWVASLDYRVDLSRISKETSSSFLNPTCKTATQPGSSSAILRISSRIRTV